MSLVRTKSHVFDENDDWDIHKQHGSWYVVVGPDHFDNALYLDEGGAPVLKERFLFPSLEAAEEAVALWLLKRASQVPAT